MSYYNSYSSTSYENEMSRLESNLRTINNNYYGVSSNNNMDKYMYYSALSNACSPSISVNSSSSCGRSMGREPNYTVGQWSIEGIL